MELIIVIFALFCCAMALWVVISDRNWKSPFASAGPDPLAGMTAAALELVRQANRPQRRPRWGSTRQP